MSLKLKIPLLILIAFVINIAALLGYYRFSLSKEFSGSMAQLQQSLDEQTDEIAAALRDEDIAKYLSEKADEQNVVVSLTSVSGEVIYESEETKNINGLTAASIIDINGDVCVLKVMRPFQVQDLKGTMLSQRLIIAEMVIIAVILILLSVFIYFSFVRDTIALKKGMDRYASGIKPEPSKRRDELGQVQNGFVRMTGVLESEKQKQNRIIASISHDIKTPLTSVLGYTERLRKGNMDPGRQQKYLDTIYQKSKSIQEIIEEFDEYLGFNLQGSLKKQKIPVVDICEMVREDFEEELHAMSAELTIQCDCPDTRIGADLSRLRRVFGNLIANSVKYGCVPHLVIDVSCRKEGEKVLFAISDNGRGIGDSEVDRIFDPLYTTDEGRSVSGLGLSICKSIVEMHGGKIWASNSDTGGLTVIFLI